MLGPQVFVTVFTLLSAATALTPPQYGGYQSKWSDRFDLAANTLPNTSKWNTLSTSAVYNNEWETYTRKPANVRHTGAGRLQLIPRRDRNARRGWTSGRIESKYTFTPTPRRITRIESQLRLGGSPRANKQGIWPAFWLYGQAHRNGVKWPAGGEIDVLENINGNNIAYGVVHCDRAPGGVCNEPIGLAGQTTIDTSSWVTWRIQFDLRRDSWREQSITWFRNGVQFHRITGARINNQAVWRTLAQQPMFIIFNVAVGGDWPGPPNSRTSEGLGVGMEIAYVAHYVSTS